MEWNDAEGKIQRHYVGFHNSSEEKARIETAANRFILAGDDSHIKVLPSGHSRRACVAW